MADANMNRKRSRPDIEDAELPNSDQIIADKVINPTSTVQPATKKARVEERRSIFVRSLPPSVTNEALTEFFSEYFPVKHATVITDQKTKESRGYGFVTFADAEDASQAKTALDKKLWDGRTIRIDIAEPRNRNKNESGTQTIPGKPAAKDEFQKPPKLIVRNLPWSIKNSEQLSHLFRSFGKVKFADLPQTKGKLKGFGFVTIRGKKNAEKALEELNGKEIDGRTLAVDWAVDKGTWEDQKEKDEATAQHEKADDEADDNQDIPQPKSEGVDADLENFMKNHMQNMEDEDDEDNEEDEDHEDADVEEEEMKRPQRTTDNSSTIFIRNLPFTTTDEQLKVFFSHFGGVRYARVVMDKATDKPAGTGFVCFFQEIDAKNCVKGAPRPQQDAAAAASKTKHSILQDENADPDGKYTLDGRLLQVAQAVSKETAANLADSSLAKRREKDKRKLFLLSEGSIGPKSPIFKLLSQSELQMRQSSAAQRKKMVEKNPSLHVSLTRLAIRNIPRDIGSKELKDLARKAIVGFAKDVKEGRREALSKEENARDTKEAKDKERERKQKGKGIVRQAKVVFESTQGSKVDEKSGGGKSRGYGFIEYTSHHWALMGLRYLNGLQLEGDNGRKQRLIVEFAIENVQVVQRRRANEKGTPQGSKAPSAHQQGDQHVEKTLKENRQARGKDQKPSKLRNGESKEGEDKVDMKQKLIARKRLMRKKKTNSRTKN